jgi:hypothetical protein
MSTPLRLTRREAVLALGGAALTLACGRTRSDQPVAIAYGRDECAWCRMTVDDPTLAAEWIDPDAPPLVFGEPGCLLSWLAAHRDARGTAWVRIRDGDQWLGATEAVFAHGVVATPMAFNLTAYRGTLAGTDDAAPLTWTRLLEKGVPDARPS